jgi:serine protease Do
MIKRFTVILAVVSAVAVLAIATQAARNSEWTQRPSQARQPAVSSTRPAQAIGFETFRDIAKAQTPMVVNIRTESRAQTSDLSQFFDPDSLQRFFGLPRQPSRPREQVTQAAGSGFIIDKDGLILTNNHVVAGATKIAVGLYAQEDGKEYDARVVGRDPLTDSALIRLTEKPDHEIPVATLGDSKNVQAGDWVMAIGNPFNLAHTVTVGVISAVGRPFPVAEGRWQDVLQTDAAINPGNSGGPLLNLRGEVIGINSAILSGGPSAGNVGVGFAIPIDLVRELLPQLRQGTITRGRIGVQITPVTKDLAKPLGLETSGGALVRMVERDGAAAAAGIEPGDVIVRYDARDVHTSNELVDMVSRTKPGTAVPVDIVRDGRRRTVRVTVETLDAEATTSSGALAPTGVGMSLMDLQPQLRAQLQVPAGRGGAVVRDVEPGSKAARGGLTAGDVILDVNRAPVRSAADVVAALRKAPANSTVLVLVWREGRELFLTMPRGQ